MQLRTSTASESKLDPMISARVQRLELGPLCTFGVRGGRREKRWGTLVPVLCAKIDRSESGFMPGARETTAQVVSWKLAQSFPAQIADGNEMPVVRGNAC